MIRTSVFTFFLLLCLLVVAGCAGSPGMTCGSSELWPDADPAKMVVSNNGTYGVQYWVISNTEGIPTNKQFIVNVFPFEKTADGWVQLTDVLVSVDAAMPHHGHGMNVVPTVTRRDDGSFLVDGMLFHMPGRWELYFDITRDGVTERAQTEVFLE